MDDAVTVPNYLECPICMEVFKDPVINSCGHTFCLKCVADVYTCPSCRQNMSRRTVKNFSIQEAANSFNSSNFCANQPSKCRNCDSCTLTFCYRCCNKIEKENRLLKEKITKTTAKQQRKESEFYRQLRYYERAISGENKFKEDFSGVLFPCEKLKPEHQALYAAQLCMRTFALQENFMQRLNAEINRFCTEEIRHKITPSEKESVIGVIEECVTAVPTKLNVLDNYSYQFRDSYIVGIDEAFCGLDCEKATVLDLCLCGAPTLSPPELLVRVQMLLSGIEQKKRIRSVVLEWTDDELAARPFLNIQLKGHGRRAVRLFANDENIETDLRRRELMREHSSSTSPNFSALNSLLRRWAISAFALIDDDSCKWLTALLIHFLQNVKLVLIPSDFLPNPNETARYSIEAELLGFLAYYSCAELCNECKSQVVTESDEKESRPDSGLDVGDKIAEQSSTNQLTQGYIQKCLIEQKPAAECISKKKPEGRVCVLNPITKEQVVLGVTPLELQAKCQKAIEGLRDGQGLSAFFSKC